MKKRLISLLLILCMVFTLFPTAVLAADAAEEPGETAAASQPAAPEENPDEPEDAGVPAAQEGEGSTTVTANAAKVGEQEYSTLADAVSNANPGDTVTLLADCGGMVSISKKITLTASAGVTFSGSLAFGSGSEGSKVEGVTFANTEPKNNISNIIVLSASDIMVQDCNFTVGNLAGVNQPNCIYVSTSGAVIRGNRFHVTRIADKSVVAVNLSGAGTKNTTVSSNYFDVLSGGDNAGSLFFFKAMGETKPDGQVPTTYITGLTITNNTITGTNAPDAVYFAGLSGVSKPTITGNIVNGYFRGVCRVKWGDYSAKNELDDTLISNNTYENQWAVAENVNTGVKYDTLAAAVNAAQKGATVKLLQNVTLSETITISKAINIDGGGHTIATDGSPRIMFNINNNQKALDYLSIRNCKFEIPATNQYTWVAIYVQQVVRNLTISGNTFNIRGVATEVSNGFHCIGFAYTDDRYTGNITISDNTVTNFCKNAAGKIAFVMGGKNAEQAAANGRTYSIVNLTISGNTLTDNSSEKQLMGAVLSNTYNLTVTNNQFLRCRAGLVLNTAGESNTNGPLAANDITDILSGNDDRGTTDYVVVLSGSAPLVKEKIPFWIPDVLYAHIALEGSANQSFAKVGFDPEDGYEEAGGKVPYPFDSEDFWYGALSGFVKLGTEIILPRPKREGYKFLYWTAVEKPESEIDHYSDPAGDGDGTGTDKTYIAGRHYTVNTSVEFIASWEKLPNTPEKPTLSGLQPVQIECEPNSVHTVCRSVGTSECEEITDENGNAVVKENGEWTYRIKIKRAEVIKSYNENTTRPAHTDTAPNEETIATMKWNESRGWYEATRAVIKVTCAKPIYAYFKPVNSAGEDITLDQAALARLHLTYNRTNHWFTYGKLMSTSTTLGDVTAELKNIERYSSNTGFRDGDKIVWTDLDLKPAGWHDVYNEENPNPAYHLDGQLPFCSVTFNANAENDPVSDMPEGGYYLNGETLSAPAAPSRTGYSFAGWYDDAGGSNAHDFNAALSGDVTIYAKWTINQYTITFDTDGGTAIPSITLDYGAAVTAPAAPTKTGYTFDGWDTAIPATMPAENTTIKAQWKINKYTITFDTDGGSTIDPITQDYNTDVTAPANPTKTGYTFTSWDKTIPEKMPAENMTIKAQWKINQYTITFDTDGGSAIPSITQNYGTAVTAPANPTKTGYTFDSWDKTIPTTMPAENTTIKAKWKINQYTITFDTDGGSAIAPITQNYGTAVTAPADPTKTGYTFAGWDAVIPTTMPANDMTIKAKWTINVYTFTFDSQGGSEVPSQNIPYLDTAVKPADPTRAGYLFEGWYTDTTFQNKYDFVTPVTGNMTVYARWSFNYIPVLSAITKKDEQVKFNTADHFAYVNGYPDGTVKPAGNITRAEVAAILYRVMDKDSVKTYHSTASGFRDVDSGKWYNLYVATLNKAGIITDSANGYFRPNDAITRAELAAMLAQFATAERAANYFNDVAASHWAANAIAICSKLGWINGYPDGSFRPDATITRAEMMAMINRALERTPKSADDLLPGMKIWSDNAAGKWYYLDVQEATNGHTYTKSGTRETWQKLTTSTNF